MKKYIILSLLLGATSALATGTGQIGSGNNKPSLDARGTLSVYHDLNKTFINISGEAARMMYENMDEKSVHFGKLEGVYPTKSGQGIECSIDPDGSDPVCQIILKDNGKSGEVEAPFFYTANKKK